MPYLITDIDDWYLEQTGAGSNRIQLTLFVEALTVIQNRPLNDQLSYFRLAGIHGAPWTEWDGVPGGQTDSKGNPTGFCVHNNYTFPTWHRVYVTLYEQVIYEAMLDFIKQNVPQNGKADWENEAKQWRLPYWDFARFARHGHDNTQGDELRLPILVTMPMVKFDKCQSTTKYGLLENYNADVWVDGGQNWLRANLALNEHPWYQNLDGWDPVPTLQDMTFRLLTTGGLNWGEFSSTRYDDKEEEAQPKNNEQTPKNWMNLEAIHNNVHNWVGGFMFSRPGRHDLKLWGAGHMSSVPVAAFDPIFWLHHCNIDRLTAIWQTVNSGSWFNDDKSKVSKDDDLRPFHRFCEKTRKVVFFRSDDVKDWRSLNYDYAITKDASRIGKEIFDLYGQRTKEVYKDFGAEDYILSIRYSRYALGGKPFQINIFFGDVDGKDFYDARSQNFVGSVFNFSGSLEDSNCDKCAQQEQEGVLSVSQLPARLAVHYYKKQNKGEVPTPRYVVVNSQGKAEAEVKVEVALHKTEGTFYDAPARGGSDDYRRVADGKRAEVDDAYRA
ncbi:common central domain of tyrosinase-domain-containing protein [Aspergillus minisclerotigenes]|uniref:tyrosinase n=1 Tax=Aspergillus minisclerotigenes TaxID=656917 RepID=A0A5N6J900_9EURO|nr:common central domain of tyrosinase-domain-containing protein [Aspergillus minisclerotigenes]